MPWYFLIAAAVGLSVDTFVVSAAYGMQVRRAGTVALLALLSAGSSVAMLVVGFGLTKCLATKLEIAIPSLGNVILACIGLYLLADSLKSRRNDQIHKSRPHLLVGVGILLSSMDAAAFGSSLSLSGHDAMPMALALILVSTIASMSGCLLGRLSQWPATDQAQAYGGMVLFSLGAAGVVA
ncbi:MAG: hypothetical protein Aurels2KO_58360 [Aureliella sp.]